MPGWSLQASGFEGPKVGSPESHHCSSPQLKLSECSAHHFGLPACKCAPASFSQLHLFPICSLACCSDVSQARLGLSKCRPGSHRTASCRLGSLDLRREINKSIQSSNQPGACLQPAWVQQASSLGPSQTLTPHQAIHHSSCSPPCKEGTTEYTPGPAHSPAPLLRGSRMGGPPALGARSSCLVN